MCKQYSLVFSKESINFIHFPTFFKCYRLHRTLFHFESYKSDWLNVLPLLDYAKPEQSEFATFHVTAVTGHSLLFLSVHPVQQKVRLTKGRPARLQKLE